MVVVNKQTDCLHTDLLNSSSKVKSVTTVCTVAYADLLDDATEHNDLE